MFTIFRTFDSIVALIFLVASVIGDFEMFNTLHLFWMHAMFGVTQMN